MLLMLLRRAFAYYVVMVALFSATGSFYLLHPFFGDQDRQFFVGLFVGFYQFFLIYGSLYYLLEGYVYCRLLKYPRPPLFTTPAILLLFLRRLSEVISRKRGRSGRSLALFFANKHVRNRLLAFVVKAYFGALMVSFARFHYRTVADALRHTPHPFGTFDNGYTILYHSMFLVDAGLAAVGYFCESALLRNRVRSVDPYPMSWLVTLACYPPFNDATGTLLPLNMGEQHRLALPVTVLLCLKIVTIFFFLIYVWATLALNIKFSNLTNRGIVQGGPYAILRHPAYFGKNMAWWFEYIPYLRHGANLLPLILWNVIYILRGLYEEKHLSADPEYAEYMRKVRYRFIPGVI